MKEGTTDLVIVQVIQSCKKEFRGRGHRHSKDVQYNKMGPVAMLPDEESD